jgi:hypothetical protein
MKRKEREDPSLGKYDPLHIAHHLGYASGPEKGPKAWWRPLVEELGKEL